MEQRPDDYLMELVRKWESVLIDKDGNAVIFFQNPLNLLSLGIWFREHAWVAHPYSLAEQTIVFFKIEKGTDDDWFAFGLFPLAVFFVKLDWEFDGDDDNFVVRLYLHFC